MFNNLLIICYVRDSNLQNKFFKYSYKSWRITFSGRSL